MFKASTGNLHNWPSFFTSKIRKSVTVKVLKAIVGMKNKNKGRI